MKRSAVRRVTRGRMRASAVVAALLPAGWKRWKRGSAHALGHGAMSARDRSSRLRTVVGRAGVLRDKEKTFERGGCVVEEKTWICCTGIGLALIGHR